MNVAVFLYGDYRKFELAEKYTRISLIFSIRIIMYHRGIIVGKDVNSEHMMKNTLSQRIKLKNIYQMH